MSLHQRSSQKKQKSKSFASCSKGKNACPASVSFVVEFTLNAVLIGTPSSRLAHILG
jgi:hypothetical protein